MEKRKRTFLSLLVLAAWSTALCACNLATIDAPLGGQRHPSEPVDISLRLEAGAQPETFRAFLNEGNITDLFAFDADHNLMRAQVDSGDGLLIGVNQLATVITGQAQGISFKDTDGTWFVVEEGGVATNRDEKGIWFISGPEEASVYDVFEAMGYAVATDRLWQLEQFRRTGRGRLSEIMGPSMLETDIYLRTVGYSDEELLAYFDALEPDSRAMVQGYVAGINRRIADLRRNPSHIPLEFTLIDLNRLLSLDLTGTLQDWSVLDLFGWIVVLQRNFDGTALSQTEVRNAALYQELKEAFPDDYTGMFEDLRWLNDPDALTYIPPDAGPASSRMTMEGLPRSRGEAGEFPDLRGVASKMSEMQNRVVERLKSINAYVKLGSYGWVVSGERTASGNPILYSGPQMGFSVPSIIFEGSIRAGGFNVSGMTAAGMPILVVGRTPHHAFAMMTGHADTEDYYIEDPSDLFVHRTEVIKVLGQDDVSLDVYRTARGPVISPLPYDPATYDPVSDGPILSWKYAHWGHEFDSMRALLQLPRATSADEFGEGLERFPASFHILYADRDGNIAYWMTGRDPLRPEGEWRLPQGFFEGVDPLEWDSEVLRERSTDRNTSQGFYCGWNNKSNQQYGGAWFSDWSYGPFHRAQVIYDYLSGQDNLEFDDVRDLAINIATTDSFAMGGNPWKSVEDHFSAVVSANLTPERTAALALLAAWDGHFVDGGEPAWAWGANRADAWVLMDTWLREVIRLTFEDELGSDESEYTLFNVLLHSLPGTTIDNNYNWFRNLTDPGAPQTSDTIILAGLDNALVELGGRPWGSGARGEITFNHLVLDVLGSGHVHTMPFSSRSTYAQCVEYGSEGPVRIESMFPLGQSGMIHPDPTLTPVFDPHFLSMTDVYDGFAHRPFPLFD